MAQAVTRAMGNGAQWGTERCLLAHGAPSVQPGFRQSADQWGWGPLLSISGSLVSCAVSGVCCHPSTCFLPGSGAGWGLGGLLTPEKVSVQPVNQKSLSCQAKSFLETLGGRTSSPLNQAWFGLYTSWLTWEFGSISFLVAQKNKESTCNVGGLGSIPGLGRSPGEGKGSGIVHSCLDNPVDRGAWRAAAHGVSESDMAE